MLHHFSIGDHQTCTTPTQGFRYKRIFERGGVRNCSGSALLQSIRRTEFSFWERGLCRGFLCDFFSGFLGVSVPLNEAPKNNTEKSTAKFTTKTPCKIHEWSEKKASEIPLCRKRGAKLSEPKRTIDIHHPQDCNCNRDIRVAKPFRQLKRSQVFFGNILL